METKETTDALSEQELFAAASAPDPVAETQPEQTAAEPESQPVQRDEKGRFAPKSEAPEQDAQSAQEQPIAEKPEAPATIPSHRLREETEAKRKAEQRAADLERMLMQQQAQLAAFMRQSQPAQPEPAKPEIWDNPDGWVREQITPVQHQFAQMREFYSRRLAEQTHGAEKVSAAFDALKAEVDAGRLDGGAVKARLEASMDPYGEIMDWHRQTSAVREIGDDPAAYRERIRQEVLAELQKSSAQPAPAQRGANITSLPPSLTRATAAAGPDTGSGGMSNDELAAYAFAPKRR